MSDEFDEPLTPPPSASDVVMAVLAETFGPWLEATPRTCSNCGRGFRDPQGEAAGNPATTCFDCDEAATAREERQKTLRALMAKTIPPEFDGKTLELRSFRVEPDLRALEAVSRWRWEATGGRSLFLWSRSTGTGKSHMAYAITRRELLEGRSVLAFEWSELVSKFRASYGKKQAVQTEDELDRAIDQADLVVLDDLGGKVSEWAFEKVWQIVNARYIQKKQIIITANFPLVSDDDKPNLVRILGSMGRRVASRLAGMCDEIEVRGADARGQAALPL